MPFQARTIGLVEGPKSVARKDTRSVQASHDLAGVLAKFDESNVEPCAGLLPAAALAQRLNVAEVVDARFTLGSYRANSGINALTVVGSMLAGGHRIDDTAFAALGCHCGERQFCQQVARATAIKGAHGGAGVSLVILTNVSDGTTASRALARSSS